MPCIRVGVAGWDYADWRSVVYPVREEARFDRLAYISRFIDVVEINSTFYRPAAPRTAESWVLRTRDREGFTFTAKAHRSVTHESTSEMGAGLPPTLTGLAPLREAGKLGALLLQFPQSFHCDDAARHRIARLGERLQGWPAILEVRHVSWERDDVESLLSETGLGWCLVDQPRVNRTTSGPLRRVNGKVAYMRLHGRNTANWFRPGAGRDARYDYLYAPDELEYLAGAARDLAARAEELYVIQNNHFRGQALVNALQMKRLLRGNRPRAPEELVAAYPALEPDVTVERHRLF
jgi:uncharacterized protein YecE (DUF72 family)